MAAQKRVLVTGATGLLGRSIVKEFERAGWAVFGTAIKRASPPKIVAIDLSQQDITAPFIEILQTAKPSFIVHSAAERSPDAVSADLARSQRLNVESTRAIASLAASHAIPLLYISTDYVFPGPPGEAPYKSSATPNPTNDYGRQKLEGEQAVLQVYDKAGNVPAWHGVSLRVPVLYGPAEKPAESAVNTLMTSVEKAQDEEVVMDDWAVRYPTHTEDVGRVCKDIAEKYLAMDPTTGENVPRILQFSSEDAMTKYQMCEIMAEVLGLPMGKMKANKQGNDPNAKVQRPYDTHLDTSDLKKLGIDVVTQDFKAFWRWQVGAFRK